MQSFVIQGGRPLSGTIRASGNKNGALPILAATVLASEEVRLTNLPRIRDVEVMVELLADLGADAVWAGPNEVRVDSSGISKTELDPDLCREIRASFLLAGPLLARFGRAVVPPPGGDVIGRRRLDTHIHAFAELGVEMEINGAYDLRTTGLVGKRMYLDEASVMGTENAIMAAVLAQGETIVGHAACEPHIQDLCRFLNALGARIEGVGSNILRIEGVDRLGGGAYRIGPEHVEVASFAALAAVTGGDLTIEDVEPDDLISIVPAFRKLGIGSPQLCSKAALTTWRWPRTSGFRRQTVRPFRRRVCRSSRRGCPRRSTCAGTTEPPGVRLKPDTRTGATLTRRRAGRARRRSAAARRRRSRCARRARARAAPRPHRPRRGGRRPRRTAASASS